MAKKPSNPDPKGFPKLGQAALSADARDAEGRFGPGWRGGPGGSRPGAGRKPDEAKAAFQEFLDHADDLAQARLMEILSGEVTPNTDREGNPIEGEYRLVVDERVVMKAIEHVQNHKHGKPTVHVKIDDDARDVIDTIDRAKAAQVVAVGKQHQRQPAAAKTKKRSRNQ